MYMIKEITPLIRPVDWHLLLVLLFNVVCIPGLKYVLYCCRKPSVFRIDYRYH